MPFPQINGNFSALIISFDNILSYCIIYRAIKVYAKSIVTYVVTYYNIIPRLNQPYSKYIINEIIVSNYVVI